MRVEGEGEGERTWRGEGEGGRGGRGFEVGDVGWRIWGFRPFWKETQILPSSTLECGNGVWRSGFGFAISYGLGFMLSQPRLA